LFSTRTLISQQILENRLKKHTFALLLLCAVAAEIHARACSAQGIQTVRGWFKEPVSVSAGGTLALFNSDEQGNQLFGIGAFVDLTRPQPMAEAGSPGGGCRAASPRQDLLWQIENTLKHPVKCLEPRIGLEAEARWLPWNGITGETQSNYLAGPRVRFRRVWKVEPYIKIMGGVSRSTFNHGVAAGEFGAVAIGGGVDIPWKHNLTIRALDYEYQFWPLYLGDPLSPHGFSTGIGYRFR